MRFNPSCILAAALLALAAVSSDAAGGEAEVHAPRPGAPSCVQLMNSCTPYCLAVYWASPILHCSNPSDESSCWYDCGKACTTLGESLGHALEPLNGADPGHSHTACKLFDGQTVVGTKELNTGGACYYTSSSGVQHASIPPDYECACKVTGGQGLSWPQSPCTAGSLPVEAPNLCLVEKPDGTDILMGWLNAATSTCYYPRESGWAPTGFTAGFGGSLRMRQLCYSGVHGGEPRGRMPSDGSYPTLILLVHNTLHAATLTHHRRELRFQDGNHCALHHH